jgi:hypothetical protein
LVEGRKYFLFCHNGLMVMPLCISHLRTDGLAPYRLARIFNTKTRA